MSITKILSGHYSPETAFVVEDYPYGFKLRCKIRYWLEVNKKGTRFVSQTTNPKKPFISWNAPKPSTYSIVGCMYLDEKDHVQWSGLSMYDAAEKAREFLKTFGEGLQEEQKAYLERLATLHEKREAAKQDKQFTV
jgi:hypothetical protein